MKILTVEQTKMMLLAVTNDIQKKSEELGEIDRRIGDGDHGIGMSIGCREIEKTLHSSEYTDVEQLFKDCGMAMLRSMGGASGILFGTVFIGISKALVEQTNLDLPHFARGVQKAVKDVKKRGGAAKGDKTMIDALEPAAEALLKAADEEKSFYLGLEKAVEAAEQGVKNTKNLVAKFGRAKFLKERAVGYQDAGATSIYYIFNAMKSYCKKEGITV